MAEATATVTLKIDASDAAAKLRNAADALEGMAGRVRISVPRELLEALVDHGDCAFDHHGGCQAHGFLDLEPDEVCPQRELKDLLDAREVDLDHGDHADAP